MLQLTALTKMLVGTVPFLSIFDSQSVSLNTYAHPCYLSNVVRHSHGVPLTYKQGAVRLLLHKEGYIVNVLVSIAAK